MDSKALTLPVALIIMDGHGIDKPGPYNAIFQARTPNLDRLYNTCPHIQINASGQAVGLPEGQMGNSEVGHLNIGAGRIVYQELTRINKACEDGSIAQSPAIQKLFEKAKAPDSVLHLMGLLSDGGVHSSNAHLYALLDLAAQNDVPSVYVHCFMDGRDVAPTSGVGYIAELQAHINSIRAAHPACDMRIASIQGRYFAMDRDNRWDRVKRAYDCLTSCDPLTQYSPEGFMQASYDAGVTDEFVEPGSFVQRGVRDGDALLFFNFRPDRARQLTRTFTDQDFDGFERLSWVHPYFVCLTEYDPTIGADVAFPKQFPENVLADVLAQAGLSQYHIAETEKYAHVTFFLNGGREEEKPGEVRVLIPSPQVATYDLQPEMSEPAVTETLSRAIDAGEADVYIVNFANCDMVGHTGSLSAAIKAVEAVDHGVGLVIDAIERKGGVALVTADHGNADKMVDDAGGPHTAHTTNPVPLILADFSGAGRMLKQADDAALCNLAPTLLDIIGLDIPAEMTASSLVAG